MKLYIDSADINEVSEIASWGILSGVTTNPSLVAKSVGDFRQAITKICELVKGPISVEVVKETADEMIEQGKLLASWHDSIVIKLPITVEGLKACSSLSHYGIPTNLTLCFSVNQALLCANAGATFVSPFIGRLEDVSNDGIGLVRTMSDVFTKHKIKTQIIAASIRTPQHLIDVALAGADIATIPYKIFQMLLSHPLTDRGIEQFMTDWKTKDFQIR